MASSRAHADQFVAAVDGRAAAAVGDVQVVDFIAGPLQMQERSGHDELDVVRMRGDGEGTLGHGRNESRRQE